MGNGILRNAGVWLAAMVSGLLLTGCETPGPKFAVYRSTLTPPAAGMGRVWFYRHSEFFGDGLQPSVRLDGVDVGDSIPGKFFQAETTPGTHTISTTTEAKKEIVVPVSTNADSYVQFYLVPGIVLGRVVPTLMNEPDALRGMEGLEYGK